MFYLNICLYVCMYVTERYVLKGCRFECIYIHIELQQQYKVIDRVIFFIKVFFGWVER